MKTVLINDVLSKRTGLTVKEIVNRVFPSPTLFGPEEQREYGDIVSLVNAVVNNEIKDPNSPIIKCSTKKRGSRQFKLRPAQPIVNPNPTTSGDSSDTNRIGKAGEFSVLAELIAHGYNANNMSVDEGIDIVASKDNVFYYIQVKTTYLESQKKISTKILIKNYERVKRHKVIYVVAVRLGMGSYKYFLFHQYDIETLIIGGYIEKTDSNILIKIRYSDVTNEPILYNNRSETSAKPYMAEIRNFEL